MSTRWQCKRDTAANWTSNNPVLLSGEWGVETDTKKLKMGDGATAWNGLAYDFSPQNNVAITGGSITGITDLAVADGGTGASTLTDHGILLGSGTAAVTPLAAATNGQIPIGSTGADPVLATIAGTADEVDVSVGAGTITIGLVNPLIAGKGGTGASTLTDHGILLGSGTDAVTPLAAATNGQIPIGSTGADPVLATIAGTADEVDVSVGAGTITIGLVNPLIAGKGGTGASTLTDHGILLGSGTDAVTPLAAATNGQIPIGSTGADPVLATIAGTANQIVVTNGAGTSTIGTPLLAGNEPVRQVIHGGVATIHAGNNGLGQSRPPNSKITQSAAIAGTRTTAQIFTRTTGTWTADVLIAQYAFFYAAAVPHTGNWLPIVDNDGTTLTVTGTILAAADTVKTCVWTPIQRSYAHGQGAAAFIGGFFDGQNGWLVPYNSTNLVKVNPADGTMTAYAHGQGAGAFAGGFFDGQNGWLVPLNSTNLVKVNPADGTMTAYAHGQGAGAFMGGFFDGQNGWLVPYNSTNLVKVNPADGTMTAYAHGQGADAFMGGFFDGQNGWLVPYNSTNLVKVNPADGTMTSYAHGQGAGAFMGGFFDGQNGWLVPRNSTYLVKVNPADGTMTSYAHGQGSGAFIGGFFDGQNGWLVPFSSYNITKVNPADGSMTFYAHGQTAAAFQGGFFDGQNGWLVPSRTTANLILFSPIGFGIIGTPNAGGVTSLLTLDDGANWRITMNFVGGILTAKTTAASSGQCATWS